MMMMMMMIIIIIIIIMIAAPLYASLEFKKARCLCFYPKAGSLLAWIAKSPRRSALFTFRSSPRRHRDASANHDKAVLYVYILSVPAFLL